MHRTWKGALLAAALTAAAPAAADTAATIGTWQVLEDPTGEATLEQVRAPSARFRDVTVRAPNYDFSHSAFWFRLPVANPNDRPLALYVKSDHALLDYVTLYVLVSGKLRETARSGDRLPLAERAYPAAALVLPFHLGAHEAAELYVRVRAEAGAVLVPFEVLDDAELTASLSTQRLVHGIELGIFGFLLVYNFVIFLLLPQRSYLFYVIWLLLSYLAMTSANGFGAASLYPRTPWINNEGVVVLSGLSYFMFLLFAREFLSTATSAALDTWVKVLLAVTVFHTLAPFLMPIQDAYRVNVLLLMLSPLASGSIGVVAWRLGRREALFYVAGHVVALVGILAVGLIVGGVLPYHPLTFELIPIALAAAALIHASGLAHRIRLLANAKIEAESTMRVQMETHKAELERVVAERTAELEAARRKAEQLATTDPLTGIYNRRGLFELAEQQLKLARRSGQPFSILMFDLDHFKRVNDTYGHAEGDRVLCDVVAAGREVVRDSDLFGRIGGEEFLVALPDTDLDAAAEIAERIRGRIAERVRVGDSHEPITASVGIACLSEARTNMDKLESAADAALYRAKRNGRNRVEIADGVGRRRA
ncbi:MAG: diguanylate cyclase [Sulfurifustis sp.]